MIRAKIEQLKALKKRGVSTVAGEMKVDERQQEEVSVVGRWGEGGGGGVVLILLLSLGV